MRPGLWPLLRPLKDFPSPDFLERERSLPSMIDLHSFLPLLLVEEGRRKLTILLATGGSAP